MKYKPGLKIYRKPGNIKRHLYKTVRTLKEAEKTFLLAYNLAGFSLWIYFKVGHLSAHLKLPIYFEKRI